MRARKSVGNEVVSIIPWPPVAPRLRASSRLVDNTAADLAMLKEDSQARGAVLIFDAILSEQPIRRAGEILTHEKWVR